MPKKREDSICVGEFKVVKTHKRLQGETLKKKKRVLSGTFKAILSLALILILAGVAIGLGLSMENYTTNTRKLSGKASAEKTQEYKSMAVIESSTGRLLMGYHEEDKLPMASTTKIATAIVAIEHFKDLTQEFLVPEKAVGIEGSSMYLRKGEKLTIEEYLYGLMLPSGNDSAVALAILVSGSEAEFSKKLNDLAVRLGLTNTNFITASGLHDENHYTTSYDLALLTAYAMRNKDFRKIVGAKTVTIRGSKPDEPRHLKNKQKLMWDESFTKEGISITGVKSGFTPEAGRCLVTSAVKNGMEVIAVVLNAPKMFESTASILKEALTDYEMVELLPPKKHITSIQVKNSETKQINLYTSQGFSYPLTKEEQLTVKTKYNYRDAVEAPVTKDQPLGDVEISLNGQTLFNTPILSIEEAKAKGFTSHLEKILKNF